MLNVREKKFGFDSFRFFIRIIVLSVFVIAYEILR